jgi:hypothetical protein
MEQTAQPKRTWPWLLWPALFMAFLALYPQINLWLARGGDWHGAYALNNYDETAYSAYVNALMEGRPRRNDPFTGRDETAESLLSIQFIPAYAIALPARALGLSAATAFILLILFIALASSLAVFWLLRELAGDAQLAATGVLTTLCLGGLAAAQGWARLTLTGDMLCDFFPFLRRYQPGWAFPLFFVFCVLVWRALTRERAAPLHALAAGATLVVLVFSYFYLWTAAAAWLVCVGALWLVGRPAQRKQTALVLAITGGCGLAALIPYFTLLARRSTNTDSAQALAYTRAPELTYAPELIGLAILAALVWGARRGRLEWRTPAVLFTASLAVLPLVVFNQQIVTGRVLQPVHYSLFIVNYVVLAAALLAVNLLRQGALPRRALLYAALLAACWGLIEMSGPTKRNAPYAHLSDEAKPVAARVAQLARAEAGRRPVVFSSNLTMSEYLPTYAPVGTLWSSHTPVAGGVNPQENKELFFRYLYYSGFGEKELADALAARNFETLAVLFGPERALHALTPDARPVTAAEARTEIQNYINFAASFTAEQARQPQISYVVAPAEAEPAWTNLDRWYARDAGEQFGLFKLYRVKLRN